MSVISQLKLPLELQELIREFVYYSKTQHEQIKKKKNMVRQLNICERIQWKDIGLYYDYFYFQIENWGFFTI